MPLEEYFQRKKLTFLVDSATYGKMQYLRGLFLLDGRNISNVPNITDLIGGMLLYSYCKLNSDLQNIGREGIRDPLIERDFVRIIPNLTVENELSQEEYDSFTKSVLMDLKDKTLKALPVKVETKGLPHIANEYPDMTSYNKSEQINMIIKEEELEIVKGLNILINKINHTSNIYSTTDVIREVISLIVNDKINSTVFMKESFIANLYRISLLDYFKITAPGLNLKLSLNLTNLRSILMDKPIVSKLNDVFLKWSKDKKIVKFDKLIDEVFSSPDSFRSYVSDFDYRIAAFGYTYLEFMLLSNLSYPLVINIFRNGGYAKSWGKTYSKNPDDDFTIETIMNFGNFARCVFGLMVFIENAHNKFVD